MVHNKVGAGPSVKFNFAAKHLASASANSMKIYLRESELQDFCDFSKSL